MKRNIIALVTVTVVALLGTALFASIQFNELQNQISALEIQNGEMQDQIGKLENQLNELQLQNREKQDRLIDFTYELAKERHLNVKITGFSWLGRQGFTGLMAFYAAKVTVQNDDVVPLSGLKVAFRVFNGEGKETAYSESTIDRIDVEQSMEILNTQLGSREWSINYGICDVYLKAGDVILDKETFSIS